MAKFKLFRSTRSTGPTQVSQDFLLTRKGATVSAGEWTLTLTGSPKEIADHLVKEPIYGGEDTEELRRTWVENRVRALNAKKKAKKKRVTTPEGFDSSFLNDKGKKGKKGKKVPPIATTRLFTPGRFILPALAGAVAVVLAAAALTHYFGTMDIRLDGPVDPSVHQEHGRLAMWYGLACALSVAVFFLSLFRPWRKENQEYTWPGLFPFIRRLFLGPPKPKEDKKPAEPAKATPQPSGE